MKTANRWLTVVLAGVLLVLAGCNHTTSLSPPDVQGSPAMVNVGGKPVLWVLTKREETRQTSVGGGNRSTGTWRDDTFFHFDLQALDPVTARPSWTKRLMTIGDPEAKGPEPSRVIGSAAAGRMIGQEGDRVWMVLGDQLLALNAADGSQVADAAMLEQRNPELKGLLPVEIKDYAFDNGLVFMSADARKFIVRGAALKAEPYVPPPHDDAEPMLKPNGMPIVVPSLPLGEIPARQVRLGGQWLGLYSPKEADDAGNDSFGTRLRYPYTVFNEGSLARRSFWRATVTRTTRFDETYDRIEKPTPIPDAPVFLRGRFLKDLATGEPRILDKPDGVAVWNVTRIDGAGRLALTRIGADLRPLWIATLPLSDNSTSNPLMVWQLSDRVIVMGGEDTMIDDVRHSEQHLASISLADGTWKGWSMTAEAALP